MNFGDKIKANSLVKDEIKKTYKKHNDISFIIIGLYYSERTSDC